MNQKTNLKRKIDGIILVDKPINLTSNAVLQRVKHLFHAKKAGHTGSLDPMATGMLPLCFGEATKFSQYLLEADKCYQVTGLLGVKTNTGDAMGEVIRSVSDFNITQSMLETTLLEFFGEIQQIPPMFSALKHQGQPLYKLARAGVEIERKSRTIRIYRLTLDAFDGKYFKLTVNCSKGTYIRSLVEDIGERLGVDAHVTQLHRCYTAGFEGETMYSLEELTALSMEQLDPKLLSMDRAVSKISKLLITSEQAHALFQGKYIENFALQANVNGDVRLYEGDVFVGLGTLEPQGILKAKRMVARTTES